MRIPGTSYRSIFAALILLASCVEPFEPPYSDNEVKFLVVDGFLDTGSKTATVKLSYAMPLDASTTNNPVRKATVRIEGEDGSDLDLFETAAGIYQTYSDQIQAGKKFKLHVTNGSKEYASDEVELHPSPSLDSVDWRYDDRGITIYLDAHDVANSTRYYLWTYTETWEYIANQQSYYIFNNKTGEVRPRNNDEFVWKCYLNKTSTKVLVTTTNSNEADVVNDFPLAYIEGGDYRLSRLYSIQVEQRALDEQSYTYWLNLQKTTENLGGLFDPLPSEVTGNMHNVKDNNEIVLGYFSGGEIQTKRIFIDKNDVPPHLKPKTPLSCSLTGIPVGKLKDYIGSDLFIVEGLGTPIHTYISTSEVCMDCRLRGGVLEVPRFWPER